MNQILVDVKEKSQNFGRILTPNEHKFLNPPSAYISLVVRISGKINDDLFRESIKKLRMKHTLLNVKIEYDEEYQSHFISDRSLEIPVRIVKREKTNQWFDELRKEHKIYSDPTKSLLIRFILIKGIDKSEIIIFANHAICDGRSLSFLARDLMECIGNPNLEIYKTIVPPVLNNDTFSTPIKANGLVKFVISKITTKWDNNPAYFDSAEYRDIHHDFWKKYEYNLLNKEFDTEQTARILKNCHDNGVTVNTAIVTAFRAALQKYHKSSPKYLDTIAIAADVRKYIKSEEKEFFGFSASGISPKFKYNQNLDFWENARKLQKLVSKKLNEKEFAKMLSNNFLFSHSMLDANMVAVLGQVVEKGSDSYEKLENFRNDDSNVLISMLKKKNAFDLSKMKMGLVCTNLGRLPFKDTYGDFKIESMFFTPSSGLLMEIVLGVVTIAGKLNISIGNITQEDSMKKIEEIASIASEYLL